MDPECEECRCERANVRKNKLYPEFQLAQTVEEFWNETNKKEQDRFEKERELKNAIR